MRLQRYNEVIFAVLSTAALLGALAAVVVFLISVLTKNQPAGVIVKHSDEPKPKQVLLFCPPFPIEGSGFEYFPVGAVVQRNANDDPILAPSSRSLKYDSRGFTGCQHGNFNAYSRIFNVVIRNAKTGEERLVLEQAGQIESLQGPAAKCKDGEGDMPCGLLLWKVRPADSNRDSVINQEDALVAYISNLSGSDVRPVTPADATVVSADWMPKSNRLVFQIRSDTNKDGKFSDEDGAVILETDVSNPSQVRAAFHENVMKRLQSALQ